MALPRFIFIDTSILDGQNYDFSSSLVRAFVDAVASRNLTLLLPLPTKQEIVRHISERAQGAVSALKRARQDHAFLRRIPAVPQSNAEKRTMIDDLRARVSTDWHEFQRTFRVVELDCSTVSVSELLTRYDRIEPPFGEGEKRKEFPDAIAFAALRNHADEVRATVGIISSDSDFQKACVNVERLRYYPSLESFTSEALQENRAFESAQAMAWATIPDIIAKIKEEFPDRAFDHTDDPNGRGSVEDIQIQDVSLEAKNIKVIALSGEGCTISFEAIVSFTAYVKYDDPDSWVSGDPGDDVWYLHRRAGMVSDYAEISGTAELSADENWTAPAEIFELRISEDSITVSEEAPEEDDRDDYEYDPRQDDRQDDRPSPN